jgi:hypothetical protein
MVIFWRRYNRNRNKTTLYCHRRKSKASGVVGGEWCVLRCGFSTLFVISSFVIGARCRAPRVLCAQCSCVCEHCCDVVLSIVVVVYWCQSYTIMQRRACVFVASERRVRCCGDFRLTASARRRSSPHRLYAAAFPEQAAQPPKKKKMCQRCHEQKPSAKGESAWAACMCRGGAPFGTAAWRRRRVTSDAAAVRYG